MARMTIETITEKLIAAKAEGRIWNADFEEVKSALSRRFDEADRAIRDAIHGGLDQETAWELSCDFICSNYTNFAGRVTRLEKKLSGRPEALAAVQAIAAPFLQVIPLVIAAKAVIVKGRKPAENPSVNARTIDHTGTCGCCNRNIKLTSGGTLWDHGYGIHGRGRGWNGGFGVKDYASCFGYGYQPIEVSNKVWIDMLAGMEQTLEQLPARIESLKASLKSAQKPVEKNSWQMTKEEKAVAEAYGQIQMALRGARVQLKQLPGQIGDMKTAIAEWKPRALPGTRKGA